MLFKLPRISILCPAHTIISNQDCNQDVNCLTHFFFFSSCPTMCMCVVNFQCSMLFSFFFIFLTNFCVYFFNECARFSCIAIYLCDNCIFTSPCPCKTFQMIIHSLQHCTSVVCVRTRTSLFHLICNQQTMPSSKRCVCLLLLSLNCVSRSRQMAAIICEALKLLQFNLKNKQAIEIDNNNRTIFILLPFELSSVYS